MFQQDPRNSLAGWFFTPDEILDATQNMRMLNSSVDLTNACNLNCPYCYIEEKNSRRKVRRVNELSNEEVLANIDDLCSCGTTTINIVGAGEPTIDPHFFETVTHIHKLGMRTVLFTNGIRISHDIRFLDFLYEHNVSIVLKYNSRDSNVQDQVAGASGYSRKRDRALDLLLDAGFAATEPTRLGVDVIVFSGNCAEIPTIHRWCRQNNIFPIAGEYIPSGRTDLGQFQGFGALLSLSEDARTSITRLLQPILPEQRQWLLETIFNIDDEFGIVRTAKAAYVGGGVCTQLLGLYIDIEGNIWPCVARSRVANGKLESGLLGNTRTGVKVSQIWRDSDYLKYVRDTYDGSCPYKAKLTVIR